MFEDEIPVGNAVNLKGQTFGKLTVLYRVKNENRKTRWKCLCECGNYSTPTADNLKRGVSSSCGCTKGTKYGDLTNKKLGV